jgi:tRNA-specific 2-thiouridylase
MSGGVDSSVAAARLLAEGDDVFGLTMETSGSGGPTADAAAAAQHLGLPHHVVDLSREFRARIVLAFADEYRRGRTPNPCVRCNALIKFGLLREKAVELGAEFLATGHHARVAFDPSRGRYVLARGLDPDKDQSYFLYRLRQEALARVLFPIGGLLKSEVREEARRLGLSAAERPESQEICFVPGGDYPRFLRDVVPEAFRPGPIIDAAGRLRGEHQGIAFYTVGQRRGLGIAAPRPLYVVEIRPEENTVVVGEDADLFRTRLLADDLNWVSGEKPGSALAVRARVRYRQVAVPATVEPEEVGTAIVTFERPQRAVAPGQSVVFYSGDEVLGGGLIAAAIE